MSLSAQDSIAVSGSVVDEDGKASLTPGLKIGFML